MSAIYEIKPIKSTNNAFGLHKNGELMSSQDVANALNGLVELSSRCSELERLLVAIVEYDEKGFGEEFIRAVDDAREFFEEKQ